MPVCRDAHAMPHARQPTGVHAYCLADGQGAGRVADQCVCLHDPGAPRLSLTPLLPFAEVKDLSKFSASIAPAEHASWHDARTELMVRSRRPLHALLPHTLTPLTPSLSLRARPRSHTLPKRAPTQAEAKAGLKARLETALSGADDDSALADIRARFENDERDLEHSIDHTVHQFSCTLDVAYNFLSS